MILFLQHSQKDKTVRIENRAARDGGWGYYTETAQGNFGGSWNYSVSGLWWHMPLLKPIELYTRKNFITHKFKKKFFF